MKNILSFLLVFILSIAFVKGQDANQKVLASAGGTAVGSSGSIEWTFGEFVIGDLNSDNFLVTQGFHQTFLSSGHLAGQNDITLPNSSISIYPNPTVDMVNITMDESDNKPKQIELIDAIGRRILLLREAGSQAKISLRTSPQGIYYLRIINASGIPIGNFKIIKL